MLLQAERELNIDLSKSIFIGDKPSDMAAGRAAGVGTLFHLGNTTGDNGSLPIQQLVQALPYL